MGTRFGRGWVFGATVLAAAAAVLMLGGAAVAAVPSQDMTSGGPLTNIWIGNDLSCQVSHTGDTSFELYGPDESPADCGTFVATGGTLYAPDFANHDYSATAALGARTPFTAVSQSAVTGSGTNVDPYKIMTVADAGATGLRITQTDSYVVGQESYRTDVQIANSGGQAQSVIVYRAGDCYLQGSDEGYGAVGSPAGAVACVAPDPNNPSVPGTRIEQWVPLTAGSHYLETFYSSVWSAIGGQAAFPDTCDCATDEDNGAGLSWSLSVPAGGSVTVSNLTNFSPNGNVPLTTSKTADAASVTAGGSDGYTITVSNPNASIVQLATITDTLPAGFSYVPGSTTGATTSNPTISAQTLTWTGPFADPAASGQTPGSISLHFGVTVSSTPGTYYNNATADAGAFTVVPTGNTAPVTVTAAVTHTLTVSKTGTGTGSVSSSPAGITCGATCSASFANGTMVTLTATAAAGSTFAGWSGGGCSGTGTCTVTLNADTTVTATFALITHTLTVSKTGTGTGGVTSSPAGINCGATCSASFNEGTMVILTATADAGSTFAGWSGGGCSGTGTCTVTLNADTTVTATFTAQVVTHTLTVSKTGTGTGGVTSSPSGINCGATCSASFANGTMVTLTATADAGSTFAGWSGGGCSGTGTCTVTLTADTTVTATFTAQVVTHTLTVSKTGTGTGSVSSSPAGITCGATCSASFANGTMVTLTATAAAGSTFAGWSGGGCSGTGTCTVTLNADTTVTATFTLQVFSHQLTVTKAGTGSGSVSSSPAGIACGSTCVAAFVSGTMVTLTATADAGSTFAGWSGGGCSGTGTCTVTLNADTTVTATFTLQATTARARQVGWWKNHDADTSALLPVKIGNYTVSSLTASSAVFAANSCGSPQGDGVGCLAAELLAAKLNVKAGSDPCIASSIAAADAFLVGVGYTGPGSYTLGDAQRSQALSLKNDLQHYDGSGNC